MQSNMEKNNKKKDLKINVYFFNKINVYFLTNLLQIFFNKRIFKINY